MAKIAQRQQMKSPKEKTARFLSEQDTAWRDPQQIVTQWLGTQPVDPALFKHQLVGAWWDLLEAAKVTLMVTREYEHLVLAMTVLQGQPNITYLSIPHPSGLVVDAARNRVLISSTRNPNMIFDFSPPGGQIDRLDMHQKPLEEEPFGKTLLPRRTRFYPGCFYIHDLALVAGELHANSVGQNAVVHLREDGDFERVWWPNCIERDHQPIFGQNLIQLNSIASGSDLAASYFSASTDKPSSRRPGHKNFPVDRRGVIFSGASREPVVFGLTRPHSARLFENHIFVDNSGYGELAMVNGNKTEIVTRLPGWTRGLAFHDGIAFVGTSRVIPRFQQYAPGLDVEKSQCGLHAVDIKTGKVLGSFYWPFGNQIFAIELAPQDLTHGFPTRVGIKRAVEKEKKIYYTFYTKGENE